MIDLTVVEEKDANSNIPANNVAPVSDVCNVLLSADEFFPGRSSGLEFEEEEDLVIDEFLGEEENTSDDFLAAVRTFSLDWLPCFAHVLQLPILGAIGKQVLY